MEPVTLLELLAAVNRYIEWLLLEFLSINLVVAICFSLLTCKRKAKSPKRVLVSLRAQPKICVPSPTSNTRNASTSGQPSQHRAGLAWASPTAAALAMGLVGTRRNSTRRIVDNVRDVTYSDYTMATYYAWLPAWAGASNGGQARMKMTGG